MITASALAVHMVGEVALEMMVHSPKNGLINWTSSTIIIIIIMI